jgi:hypothetical protein
MTILVSGEVIRQMGPSARFGPPAGARVIDASGKTGMRGLAGDALLAAG